MSTEIFTTRHFINGKTEVKLKVILFIENKFLRQLFLKSEKNK